MIVLALIVNIEEEGSKNFLAEIRKVLPPSITFLYLGQCTVALS